ncbi:PEN family class A beta-lactamase, Bpc-type [Fodinicola feengrottensis]|uniref:PEN family class A beta-lactamase, Bpc-type n=1 Tax=Fodinicola feengrottensis TaxID=435914 RepID=A0ABP4SH39_9ACTN
MPDITRRSLLALSAVGVLAPALLVRGDKTTNSELQALESQHGARLGVWATNTRTGATVAYRAGERFPMCSTFKTLAVTAILRRDHDGEFLKRVITYTQKDVIDGSPITKDHVGTGMSVSDLCAAAIDYSDNTAANLLLRLIGGPSAVTQVARSLGDPYTRLDRNEPTLNTSIPGDLRDTTTPAAFAGDYRRLVLGEGLCPEHRERLTGWLKANTTSANRFHAGLPSGWVIGDKTGSGDYGTANDVGVVWTTHGTPIVIAVLTTKFTQDAGWDEPLVASAAAVVARTLAPGE